jgi:high-affinity K+ transport system ATPase subunit B
MLSNRSSTASIFELISGRPNKLALFIFFAGMVAMILIFSVDIIRQAFSLSALEPIDAVTILVCAIPAVLWFELYKIRNKLRKKQLSASH